MLNSLLVRLFGFNATLHHGDSLVWDRWRWLKRRLRRTCNNEALLDVGCGSGAFTIGMSLRGYRTLGLSWDERNQKVAEQRATLCGAKTASFEICDVRELDQKPQFVNAFDFIICTENIEHVIDDFRLVAAMANCLKPGGRLFLTSPYLRRVPWSSMDYGPFPDVEFGPHVRCGYNRTMIKQLCDHAGLTIEEIDFISGPISQGNAWLLDKLGKIHPVFGWAVTLPLRPLPPLLDPLLTRIFGVTPFCIGVEACKPRIPAVTRNVLATPSHAAAA